MTESLPMTPEAALAGPGIRVLFSAQQIAARVREMGLEIARDLEGQRPVFVGVLKGASMFQCDLARATPLDLTLDYLSVSSYGAGTTSSGTVRLVSDLRNDIAGAHVVICEGVVDSGLTLTFILDLLRSRNPASVRVATLLDRKSTRLNSSH